ncbi:MAG: class I SAM-dependent methyltransferase [Saprospiraceae bacterium]
MTDKMYTNTNTARSFSDKWTNNPNLAFDETLREGSDIFNWILNRNGFKDGNELKDYLKSKKRILDAGCGNGRVTALLHRYANIHSEVVGIDLVSSEIARENLKQLANVKIYSKDLLDNLTDLGKFDFIYSQEVLHHTKDPHKAFENLLNLLSEDGEIAIYVYKIKAPIREYTDDFVRNAIINLPYEEAMEVCRKITDLGKSLSSLNIKIKTPSISILDIQEGEYDIQRFIYHFFMKCFWNKDLTFEDNAAINYDWYHPQDCSRHSVEEIRSWFRKAGLKINHEMVDYYGITVRGKKLKL